AALLADALAGSRIDPLELGERPADRRGLDLEHREPGVAATITAHPTGEALGRARDGGLEVGVDAGPQGHQVSVGHRRRIAAISVRARCSCATCSPGNEAPATKG